MWIIKIPKKIIKRRKEMCPHVMQTLQNQINFWNGKQKGIYLKCAQVHGHFQNKN